MAIKFSDCEAGDALVVTGKHIINDKVAVPVGSKVIVTKVMKFGVEVKDVAGRKHVFGFEHGAEKLELAQKAIQPEAPKSEGEELVDDHPEAVQLAELRERLARAEAENKELMDAFVHPKQQQQQQNPPPAEAAHAE